MPRNPYPKDGSAQVARSFNLLVIATVSLFIIMAVGAIGGGLYLKHENTRLNRLVEAEAMLTQQLCKNVSANRIASDADVRIPLRETALALAQVFYDRANRGKGPETFAENLALGDRFSVLGNRVSILGSVKCDFLP